MNGVSAKVLVRITNSVNKDFGDSPGVIHLLSKAVSCGNFSPFLSAFALSSEEMLDVGEYGGKYLFLR
jgi:hypothetical protein